MIDVSNLTKWYGPTCAVDDLTFQIPKGQIVGFLGPNGAGKSTTLRMLTGFLPPTNGTIRINECDVLTDSQSARAAIGYQPENTPLYPEMRVAEYLHYRGKLFGMDREQRRQRIDIVCDRCGLEQVRNPKSFFRELEEPPVVLEDQAALLEPFERDRSASAGDLQPSRDIRNTSVTVLLVQLGDRHQVVRHRVSDRVLVKFFPRVHSSVGLHVIHGVA